MPSFPDPVASAEMRPSPDLVRSELTRLLKGDQFKNSKRCQNLLAYLVEETLEDRTDLLKERLIGIHVFGRQPNYDTAEDPVVRNAAIEVRKRLAQFYVDSDPGAVLRIHLHAGKYVPEFRYIETATPHVELQPPSPMAVLSEERQPVEPATPSAFLSRRRTTVLTFLSVILIITAFLVMHHFQPSRPFGRSASNLRPADAPAGGSSSGSVAAAGDAVRILVGSDQSGSYVDRFGNHWSSDQYFTGGQAVAGVTNFFFPPADPVLYRTMRQGSFDYDIPLKKDADYEMRLYFAERQYRYGNRVAGDGENLRTFQVRANGHVILDHFDIIEDSGFAATTVRAFKNIAAAQDGKLHLQFVAERDQPLLAAIELLPMVAGSIPPIRIHMSPSEYTDQNGRTWSSDNFYIGGQLFDSGAGVSETQDPDLFSVARFGNFSYAIPVPPGSYALTLYFAETWFHDPGRRVFDVTCNGSTLISGLDIVKQAGFGRVYKKTFHGLQPNGQGKLLISFSPSIDYASIRALEVTAE
ncbi:MAG TPA: malectin domain-containing carbohydrate-binding protein [Acidobacteriaceae bacterium]|nr:malectin domain-containing carbohydrate-binding protein [Acidobacteriaceae bacterium]